MSGAGERRRSPVEVLGLREDVVRVEGRDGEDADAGVGESLREDGEDADEGEVERPRDAERTPAVAAGSRVCRHEGRRADERPPSVAPVKTNGAPKSMPP